MVGKYLKLIRSIEAHVNEIILHILLLKFVAGCKLKRIEDE